MSLKTKQPKICPFILRFILLEQLKRLEKKAKFSDRWLSSWKTTKGVKMAFVEPTKSPPILLFLFCLCLCVK